MNVDVVIVHYTSGEHLARCVESLRSVPGDGAIVVVDNDAPEPVPQAVRERSAVRVARSGTNLGFARGANLGARGGTARRLLFLNPDVEAPEDVLRALHGLLDAHPDVAAVAPALRDPDGGHQVGAAGTLPTVASVARQALPLASLLGFPGTRSLFVSGRLACAEGELVPVDWLSAACLLIRRRAFEQVGGFDERFFLYGEDIDLGRRLRERGWRMGYAPWLKVTHVHLQADRRQVHRAPDDAWIDGLDTYYRIHTPRARRLLHAIAWCGFGLRALAPARLVANGADPRQRRRRMRAFMRRSAHHAWTA